MNTDSYYKDRLLIKRNYYYTIIYQITVMVIPIITIPFVSRALGSDGIGKNSFVISLSSIASMIASLGTALYGQKQIAVALTVKDRSKVFWEIMAIRLFSFSIVLFLYFIVINLPRYVTYKELSLIGIMYITGNMIDISWFYLGIEEVRVSVIGSLIIRLISAFTVLSFVKQSSDLILYVFINCGSVLLGSIILWIPLKARISFTRISLSSLKERVIPIISLFIPLIASQIYPLLDKIMITTITRNDGYTGMYSQSDSIIRIALAISVTSLTSVSIARVSKYISSDDFDLAKQLIYDNLQLMFFGCFLIIGGIEVGATHFSLLFFGDGYSLVPTLLRLMSPLLVIIGFTNIMGQLYYVPTEKYTILTRFVVATFTINIISNCVLIHLFGAIGASIATVISEMALLIMYVINTFNFISYKTIAKSSLPYVFASILATIISLLLNLLEMSHLFFLITEVVVYCSVYFAVLLFNKDKITSGFINKIRGLVKR